MDRSQAIYLLKELYDQIPYLNPQTVDLIESKSNDPMSPRYSVHFKGLCSEWIEQIIKLVRQYGLKVKVTEDELIIYSLT